MNPEAVAAFTVPAFLLGVVWLIMSGVQKIARNRHEAAKSRAAIDAADADPTLRADVDQLKRELSEVQERLDFTERMLARGADRDKLGRG